MSLPAAPSTCDVLLEFPPLTEALFFPYLSLPMLTAHLRSEGWRASQHDGNLGFAHGCLEPAFVAQLQGLIEDDGADRPAWHGLLLDVVQSTHDNLFDAAFRNASLAEMPWPIAQSLLRVTLHVVTHGALLARGHSSLRALTSTALDASQSDLVTDRYLQQIEEVVRTANPRVVGFSVAFFSQLFPALRAATHLRRARPDLTIILGGQQLMLRGEELSGLPGVGEVVDAVCTGDGQPALSDLLQAMVDRPHDWRSSPISNCVTSKSVGPAVRFPVDQWTAPSFDGLPVDRYLENAPQLPVVSCVGCYWGRCTFCSYGNRSIGSYQQLRATQLARFVIDGLGQTGATRVTFVDENSNLRLLLRAVQLVRAEGYRFEWSTRNRLEPMLADPDVCAELAESGCIIMSVGYETNVQRLLDRVDKGLDASTFQTIVDNLHAVGVALRVSVMGGLVDESEDEAASSMEFLRSNSGQLGIDVAQMMIVEPGTRLVTSLSESNLGEPINDVLRNNDGLSFLGGRHGAACDYLTGPSFDERRAAFAAAIGALPPGLTPRETWATEPMSDASGEYRLQPWVRLVEDPDTGSRGLVDLANLRRLALRSHAEVDADGQVRVFSTDGAQRSIGALIRAGVLVPVGAGR